MLPCTGGIQWQIRSKARNERLLEEYSADYDMFYNFITNINNIHGNLDITHPQTVII